ncbi:MAG: hypothetical protein PHX24_01445 [Acidithiobacillus sp.]|nr:hypothetical protein [Acidithiobacillus sp.]
MDYRKAAWEFSQKGQIDEAMTAWTMAQRTGDHSAVIKENLGMMELWLSDRPKDGFLQGDNDQYLLHHLMNLQKQIKNTDDLNIPIQATLNEWRTSPSRNLYEWTLNQIKSGIGSPAKVLVLSAIGEYLEQSVEKAGIEIGTTIRSKL